MKNAVGPHLLESIHRGVYGLSGSGEGAGSQHLYLLRMMDLGSGVDDFLLSLKEFLSEVAELQYLSFDEGIP